jgi:hypothetical protein
MLEGFSDELNVGKDDGIFEPGIADGIEEGLFSGLVLGLSVGETTNKFDGFTDGDEVGIIDGTNEGI